MKQERESTIKDMLEQYAAAKTEMQLIDVDLHSYHTVSDSVKGSLIDHPYTLHTVPVEGVDLTVQDLLQARRAKLARLRLEVERFLAGVDDPHIAALIRIRYVKGKTWAEVAQSLGGGNTESGVRMALDRFFARM